MTLSAPKTAYTEAVPVVTKDGSVVRELIHPTLFPAPSLIALRVVYIRRLP